MYQDKDGDQGARTSGPAHPVPGRKILPGLDDFATEAIRSWSGGRSEIEEAERRKFARYLDNFYTDKLQVVPLVSHLSADGLMGRWTF